MVSLNFSLNFRVSQKPISSMNIPCIFPIFLVMTPPKREYPLRFKRGKLNKNKLKNRFLLDFSECCGVVRMCKRWGSDGESELELKVLEFMKNSKNPNMFPSKKEMVDAGRMDLVEEIVKRGNWMSMGWDDSIENEVKIESGLVKSFDFGSEKSCKKDVNGEEVKSENMLAKSFDFGIEKYYKNDGYEYGGVFKEINEGNDVESVSLSDNSLSAKSSSCASLELETEEVSGIEGILHRLERQRDLSFGISSEKKNEQSGGSSKDVDSRRSEGSVPTSLGHDRPMYIGNGSIRSYPNSSSSSLEADSWRAWSVQRAGYLDKQFEADEIDFGGNPYQKTPDGTVGEMITVTTDIKGGLDLTKDLDSLVREMSEIDVKNRLQHLKLELSSAICSLRSNIADLSEKAEEHSSGDLWQFSDASEFQENEIMHTQDKLRSMRAKLTVLEGKMALAIIDAQKILEEKQKRIDEACLALQLLRTTCIVWPNSGSEVLLAGSFDGWATQRKMERSSPGIFSLYLKLYPGQYEIKFIVDGAWMVDPLRPIVNHNGYDNNLLIIS